MRKDVSVMNDSGGLSLISSAVVDRVIKDNRENDQAFAAAREVVLFTLPGDESFIARVVLDEPLTPAEEAAWVARVSTRLKVPCGRLLVCGGFDPRMLETWRDEGESDEEAYTREIKIPAGEYRVDLYSHMPSMAASFVREEWREKVGAWFRREHPKAAFPQWLVQALETSPEEDPGHEKEWEDVEAAKKSGKLPVEEGPEAWVQYLVHLRPTTVDSAELSELGEDGWFDYTTGARLPRTFPHAVPAEGVTPP